jgi:hypothetical protein
MLPPTTVFIQKLRALTEHRRDFGRCCPRHGRSANSWTGAALRLRPPTIISPSRFLVLAGRLGLREA